MDGPEGIMLSEISQMWNEKYWRSHLYVESKKAKLKEEAETGMLVPRGWETTGDVQRL